MKKILIVDDKPDNLYLLQSLLEAEGFKVTSAKNGAEAFGLMRTTVPDLIISDILMPVMDGFTLCRECKKDKVLKKIPFFFYTATYTDSKDEEFALKLGADKYIIKPQEPDAFMKIITDFMNDVRTKKVIPKQIKEHPETVVLKEYNEVLVRKIEDKMLQTEKSEKELRHYSQKLENEILEHKKSEISLQESRRLFQTLAEVSPVGIFRTSSDGRTTYVNPKWSELTGIDPEHALGMGWLSAVHPDDRLSVSNKWSVDFKKGKESKAEFRFLKPDGNIVWVMGKAVPEIINETIEGYVGTLTDITERMRSEEAVVESETKYRQLVTQSPDGIFIVDLTGRFISVNKAVCENLKYTEEELLTMKLLEIIPEKYHSIHKGRLASIIQGKGMTTSMEYEVLGKDGVAHYVEVLSVPYYKEKKIAGFQGIARDITERKKMEDLLHEREAHFRSYFETSLAGIAVTSPDAGWIEVNDRLCEMMGYKREELLKTKWTNITYPDDLNIDLDHFKKVLSGEINGYSLDKRFNRKDGQVIWTSLSVRCVRNSVGSVKYFVALLIDITERKRAEEELIKAKEKAVESDKLKTAFLHNISHEIRTPMNAIVGFSAMLSEPGLDEMSRTSFIETITQSSNQLLSIINDIIEISNIEAGIIKISKTEVEINSVLKSLFNQFKPKADEKKLLLNLSLPLPDNEAIILTDNGKLVQIVSNLLSNALKFTAKGQISFGYKLIANQLRFQVSDTGIGISKDQLTRVFDRFYQIDHTLERHYEGTGLGLSITKAFVELLGGNIWVESQTGKGSFFYFTIPYIPESGKPSPARFMKTAISLPREVTILVAEDNENNFNLIRMYLSRSTVKIIQASTGREAVDICNSDAKIDLILMDLKMPEMDGYEATTAIRKIRPDIPVIAQSAFVTDKEEALNCGCTDILTKPFSRSSLLEIIEKYLKV